MDVYHRVSELVEQLCILRNLIREKEQELESSRKHIDQLEEDSRPVDYNSITIREAVYRTLLVFPGGADVNQITEYCNTVYKRKLRPDSVKEALKSGCYADHNGKMWSLRPWAISQMPRFFRTYKRKSVDHTYRRKNSDSSL
jgi:hypothetical protein